DLPGAFRCRISAASPDDWAMTMFPTAADLDAARRELSGLEAAGDQLQRARDICERRIRQQERGETMRQSLAVLEADLPGHPPALRREHAELEAEDSALKEGLANQRKLGKKAQEDLEELEREQDAARQRRAEKDRHLNEEKVRREGYQEALGQARSSLPP